MAWTPESMMVTLSKIENSRVGAGLQKDGEFSLDLWMWAMGLTHGLLVPAVLMFTGRARSPVVFGDV